jgi:hypothetical protein
MGRAFSTYEESRDACRVLVGKSEERNHLEDEGIDGTISKWFLHKRDGSMDWIDLAQDRGEWRAVVNAVMNLRDTQNAGKFPTD